MRWPILTCVLLCSWTAATAADSDATIRCRQTERHIIVQCGDQEVLRYNIVAPEAPSEEFKIFERSGYIHPIFTPSGRMITGDFAPDHAHQHGLFVAWTKTTYDGKRVDFWNQKKALGVVLHDRVIDVGSSGFKVAVKHLRLDKKGNQTPILDDVWTVNVARKEDQYAIELSIAQTNITDKPLTIDEYHYGGIGFRGNNGWYSDDSATQLKAFAGGKSSLPPLEVSRHRFLTSEGKRRVEGNHSRPEWTLLYGRVDDQLVSVRVAGSDSNFRHPHPMRLHPHKPYFSISPCVLGEFNIEPGETYRASYLFAVRDGLPSSIEP